MSAQHEKPNKGTEQQIVLKSKGFEGKINPKDLKLLDTIARKYLTRIVGEEKNIKTLVCCLVSKDLPKKYRLNVVISNQSSTGKSHLLNNVLEPFHDYSSSFDDVIDLTDFTEAYLKRCFTDVNGKIIKLEQIERKNENNQLSPGSLLKHLLSEGRIRIGLVDKNEKGKNMPTSFEVVGVPVFVSTTTKFEIDSETANRVFMMQLDESENQTEKIIEHTLDNYSEINLHNKWDDDIKKLRIFFKNLKNMAHHVDEIIIPFAPKLKKIMPRNLEIRRDLKKILNLTCVIAFIHALNRDQLRDNEPKHFIQDSFATTKKEYTYRIIAQPQDLVEAMDIAGSTIKQTLNKSSQKLMEVYSLLKQIYNEKGLDANGGITVKEMLKKSELSANRLREYLNELVEKGFADKDYTTKEHKYYPLDKKFSELDVSNIIFNDAEYQEWKKGQEKLFGDKFTFVPSCNHENDSISKVLGIESEDISNEIQSRDIVKTSCYTDATSDENEDNTIV